MPHICILTHLDVERDSHHENFDVCSVERTKTCYCMTLRERGTEGGREGGGDREREGERYTYILIYMHASCALSDWLTFRHGRGLFTA